MDYRQIADLIANSRKTTPSTVYVRGAFEEEDFRGAGFQAFGEGRLWILIGGYPEIDAFSKRTSGAYPPATLRSRPAIRPCRSWTCAKWKPGSSRARSSGPGPRSAGTPSS